LAARLFCYGRAIGIEFRLRASQCLVLNFFHSDYVEQQRLCSEAERARGLSDCDHSFQEQ
jgi:hypothetical protein